MPPLIGVLALQGAFREHMKALASLGAHCRELRQKKDCEGIDALVLPGGESTTMGKLLVELDMLAPLRARLQNGMPAYGTCAGMILLCRTIENSAQPSLGTLDASVRRNAFGRQVDSFEAPLPIPELGETPFPAVFIRAPVVTSTGPQVRVLAKVDGNAVAIQQANILATSFHPELTNDTRMHDFFLRLCEKKIGIKAKKP